MRVAVAGGGIAGLTAGIALAGRGFSVDIFERAPELEEIGAGIQLAPNAMAALDRLGVVDGLRGRLSEPKVLVVRDGQSGAAIATLPLGAAARRRYGAPYCTLHRADLQAGLVAAARRNPAITLHLGAEVRSVEESESEVRFVVGEGEHRSDVLIGADGVHSRIRTGVFGHAGATPLDRAAWRATPSAADVAGLAAPDAIELWLGRGAHLVTYPIEAGATLNIVVIARSGGAAPPSHAFGAAASRLLSAVDAWRPRPLVHVDATSAWASGRIALVGDAAHAMAPSAAQGGAQAIEDAWGLARALAAHTTNPRRGLAAFERDRRPRVTRVVRSANRNLNRFELDGVPAFLRNSLLRALPAGVFLSHFDWLFGWRPE